MSVFCKDCQYLSRFGLCHSPKHPIDPVTGEPKSFFPSVLRESEASLLFPDAPLCGPEGRNFKEKEVEVITPWWKFWSSK